MNMWGRIRRFIDEDEITLWIPAILGVLLLGSVIAVAIGG